MYRHLIKLGSETYPSDDVQTEEDPELPENQEFEEQEAKKSLKERMKKKRKGSKKNLPPLKRELPDNAHEFDEGNKYNDVDKTASYLMKIAAVSRLRSRKGNPIYNIRKGSKARKPSTGLERIKKKRERVIDNYGK